MKLKISHYKYFLLTLTLGLSISFLFYQTEYKHQQRYRTELFNHRVNQRFNAIENTLNHSFSSIKALHAFFQSSIFVNREEFRIFSHTLLKEHPEIQALEWIPIITSNERLNYEKGVKQEGFSQYKIRESAGNNQFTIAKSRSQYYPVHYVEPLKGNEEALNFDLGSNEIRLNAIKLAVNRNAIAISEPIRLVQEKQGQKAILIFQPLFEKPLNLANTSQSPSIRGYLLMVMRLGDFYQYAIASVFKDQQISIAIKDKLTNQWLVGNGDAINQVNTQYHKELQLLIGGRHWLLVASAPADFHIYSSHKQARVILLISLLASFFLALYIHILKRQNHSIYKEVNIRTKALQESRACYKAVIDTAVDAIISIDKTGLISQFNASAENLFGYTSAEVMGRNVSMLMDKDHAPRHDGYLSNYLNTGVKKIIGISREVSALHKDGHLISIHLSISDTGTEGDKRFTGIIRDLSQINAAKEKIHQHEVRLEHLVRERTKALEHANNKLRILSEIDPLTKIANRRVYDQRLVKEIATAKRTNQPLALMMIDIDYFKAYNDNYGHEAGDNALIKVAEAINKSLPRKTDLAARFGGEEFVVLMFSTDAQGAYIVAENIRKKIKSLVIRHQYSTAASVVTASIGVTSLQGDDLNSEDLFNQADAALYLAKEKSRNRCEIYPKVSNPDPGTSS